MSMLSSGKICTIHSLNARPDLNGRRGVVVTELDAAKGRIGVQIEGEDKPLALKPANLEAQAGEEEERCRVCLVQPCACRGGVSTLTNRAGEEERRKLDEAIAALHNEAVHGSECTLPCTAVANAKTFELQEQATNEFVTSTLEEAMASLSRTIADFPIGWDGEERPCLTLSRGPFADKGCRILMLAVGLVDGPTTTDSPRKWDDDNTLVLPEGATVEQLKQALALLRAAHRTQCFAPRPEATARLVPRLAHASHAELVALLAAAAIRDKETLAAAEQVLTRHHSACPWETLPDLAISTVASKLDGLAGLRWCAVCKAYRAAQPPVRILTIGSGSLPKKFQEEHRAEDLENPGIGGIALSIKCDYDTHRRIESISPRHAAEITHLSFAAVDPRNGPTGEPLRDHLEQPHGAHLTALRFLRVLHPTAGNTLPDHRHTLASHVRELVLSVSSTLRDLRITAATRFTAEDMISLLPHVGPRLHHLHADLVPFCGGFSLGGARGDPADTQRLRDAVQLHCTALRSEAELCCHRAPRN